jgi:hypothetical protein
MTENDLVKQDKQTDKPIFDCEMLIYEFLGVHPKIIDWWRKIHGLWYFKSKTVSGTRSMNRLTGVATTSIGNLITNMLVSKWWVKENYNFINSALFLGDDFLANTNHKPDI